MTVVVWLQQSVATPRWLLVLAAAALIGGAVACFLLARFTWRALDAMR